MPKPRRTTRSLCRQHPVLLAPGSSVEVGHTRPFTATAVRLLADDAPLQVVVATDAGNEFRQEVLNETEEVRNWLATEGGMAMTRPDKADFIKAAQGVQNDFAEQRGEEFVDLVKQIQNAAN